MQKNVAEIFVNQVYLLSKCANYLESRKSVRPSGDIAERAFVWNQNHIIMINSKIT